MGWGKFRVPMQLFGRHFWKFFAGLVALIVLGLGVIYLTDYYSTSDLLDEVDRQKLLAEDLQRQYEEDTYGGTTPEETLELFISALKTGDIDLASKYFVIDDQLEAEENLIKIKADGRLSQIIDRTLALKKSKAEADVASFIILGDNGVMQYQVLLGKNTNSIWKIVDL